MVSTVLAGLMLAGGGLVLAGNEPRKLSRVVVCDDNRDPVTLDPFYELSEKKHTLIQQIMEGLVRFDANAQVIPVLAERWEQVDPHRLRFFLRKNVKFHNGEPFDAESVRFTLQRFIDPATHSPVSGLLSSIEGVKVLDDHTVDIVTRQPDGLLLRRLAGLVVFVPAKDYAARGPEAFAKNPVGTGPFRIKEWKPNEEIVLETNRDYWSPVKPNFDELVMRFLPTAEDQTRELLKGNVDLMTELPGTYTLRVQENAKTRVIKREALYTVGGHFNTSLPPFDDVRVRRAVNLALNKEEFIRYDLLGNGEVVATVCAPGQIGHDPSLQPYSYDLAKAKALMAAAGVKTPVHMDIFLVPFVERPARIIKKQLEAIGIDVGIHVFPEGEAISAFKSQPWNLGLTTLPSPIAHVAFPMGLFFYSNSFFSMHHDPIFDRMYEKATSIMDPAESEKAFQELERKVYDDALGVFLYRRIKTYAVSRRVRFSPYLTGMPHFVDAVSLVKEEANKK